MTALLRKAELATAIALTALATFLNFLAASSAGPLWRDEANTVGLATLPSMADVWSNLQYDSFPIGWIAIVRALAKTAGEMNDPAFRVTGFIIAMLVIAAMWINARSFKLPYPLVSLALLALNASVIRWGTSLRGYGLGMAAAILTCVAIWRYVEQPRAKNLMLAVAAATVSVHILYYNAPVVFAFAVAGITVAAARRQWKIVVGVLAVGATSALSLLIYIPTISGAASWNPLVQIPNYDLRWFFYKLNQTFHVGAFATMVWLFLLLLAASAAAMEVRFNRSRLPREDRWPLIYAGVALVIGSVAQYVFLKKLSYLTQPWYYLTLLGLSVICIDVILGKIMIVPLTRILRLGMVVSVVVLGLPATLALARARMTNVDQAAALIERNARPQDQIVLDPWYIDVSFSRYYRGAVPWTTVPLVEFSRFHRYDLMRSAMVSADQNAPAAPAIEKALTSLRNGGTVYYVGEDPFGKADVVKLRKAAVLPEEGWKSSAYQRQWDGLFKNAVALHARSIVTVAEDSASRISQYETLKVTVIKGWRD